MTGKENTKERKEKLLFLLRAHFKFRDVPEADLLKIISYSHFASYKKGSHIVMQGDEVSHLHFILSGTVENYLMTASSARKVLNTLHPGDDFSLPDMVNSYTFGKKSDCYSICLEDAVIALISKDDFMKKCINIPSISQAYIEMMSMIINELCNELVLSTAESKVASYLCYLIDQDTPKNEEGIHIRRKFSMQKYADILLLSRENVHRVLTRFEKIGILKVTRTEIIIMNKNTLASLANNMSAMMGFYGSK